MENIRRVGVNTIIRKSPHLNLDLRGDPPLFKMISPWSDYEIKKDIEIDNEIYNKMDNEIDNKIDNKMDNIIES
jgi:hypothetical protein